MGKDAEGYVIMVWTDSRDVFWALGDETNEAAVYGQIYDPDLKPIGSNFRISKPIENGITSPHQLGLLVLDDGRFVVTWRESTRSNEDGTLRRIVMTMLNRQGETLIPEQTVNDNFEEVHRMNPSIFRVPGNRYLIAWTDFREGERLIYGRFYDCETGDALGDDVRLGPDVENFKSIRFGLTVLFISEELYGLVYFHRFIQYYDRYDNPVGEIIDLNEPLGGVGGVQYFGTDTLIVFTSTGLGDKLWFQFTDLAGIPYSDRVLINDNDPLQSHGGTLFARNPNDGSFMLVWVDRRNSYPAPLTDMIGDIYAQRYDSNSKPIGINFKVNHESWEKSQNNANVLHHRGDNYIVTWSEGRAIICYPDQIGGGSGFNVGIKLDFYNPVPGPVWGWETRFNLCYDPQVPVEFQWMQNFPNPFNHKTTLVFELNTEIPADIEIEIYDTLGRLIRNFHAGTFWSGRYYIPFNASGLSSGLYIARITSPQIAGTGKIITLHLIK